MQSNILCFVTARAGSTYLLELLQGVSTERKKLEGDIYSALELDKDSCLISKEKIPVKYLFGDMLSQIKREQKKTNHSIFWHTYIGDWWGTVFSSAEVPEPYTGQTITRFGKKELNSLPGNWTFIYQIRDPRNHIHSWRNTIGEKASSFQQTAPADYFRYLCKAFRNRYRIAIDNNKVLQNFYLTKFEDLVDSPQETVHKIMSLCGVKSDLKKLEACIEWNRKAKIETLHSTFREKEKMNKNYWIYWTQKEKDIFKEIAGKELIELGYEKDYNW